MRPGFGGGGARVLALWRLVWVLLATLLVACGPAPVGPLKVGLNPWVGYDPLVLARDKSLLDARKVKVVELSSSSDSLRQFRNGQLDAAALTLDEALRLADAGEDIRIIAVLSMSAGADVVMARQDIRSPADLRGRHIAVERTTVGALMLQRLLQAGGLAMGDVFVHNMEASQHLSALRSGLVEAAVTFEPLAGTMRVEGFRSVFDSRQMPGEIADVIVVHARTLASRPDQVLELARGWRRGLEVFQKEPQLSAELLSAGVDLSPADYLSTLKGLRFVDDHENRALLGGRPRLLGQRVEGLALTLQMMGLLRDRPDWGRLLEEDWSQRLADGTEDLS
ncbi:ABC transporter substrate-binding protein [Hydrogenophaga sp.]|uniref:ABC transporter substrate-binding protein n=1 Tax=Hydrogenophaga sp. TaxID=1904254 RepID=UPI0035AE4E87